MDIQDELLKSVKICQWHYHSLRRKACTDNHGLRSEDIGQQQTKWSRNGQHDDIPKSNGKENDTSLITRLVRHTEIGKNSQSHSKVPFSRLRKQIGDGQVIYQGHTDNRWSKRPTEWWPLTGKRRRGEGRNGVGATTSPRTWRQQEFGQERQGTGTSGICWRRAWVTQDTVLWRGGGWVSECIIINISALQVTNITD